MHAGGIGYKALCARRNDHLPFQNFGDKGQILVIDLPDRKAVEQLVADDPFVKTGVFSEYNIRRFRISVEGGKLT